MKMKEKFSNRRILILLLAAAAACMIYAVWEIYLCPGESVAFVEKSPAGGSGKSVELKAVVEGEEPLNVNLNVPAAQFTEEEAGEYFKQVVSELQIQLSGDGRGNVTHDLSLPGSFPDNPVTVEWQSSRPSVLSSAGKIGTPDASGEEVSLTAVLTLGEREEKYIFNLTVFPKEDEEGTAGAIAREAEKLNEGNEDEKYYLPSEYEGRGITWYEAAGSRAGTLAVILLLAALLLVVRERKRNEERDKKRNEELKKAYPELISMVLLLSYAGLSIRKIMYRISGMPDAAGNSGRDKSYGPAFAEIEKVCSDMDNGIGETEAYERLGTRCAGAGYRTFAMLLSRSTVRGGAGLLTELEQEAYRSFEDAKRRAKAAGDMAAVKLLLPMALMLVVVMIVILVPSFLSFMG